MNERKIPWLDGISRRLGLFEAIASNRSSIERLPRISSSMT